MLTGVIMRASDLCAVVQRHPAQTALQLAPAGSGASAGGHLHNGEDSFPGILTDAGVVSTGSLADVQVRDVDAHKERDTISL